MTGYALSPRARADIEDIWAYGESRWGFGQTEAYLRQMQRAIDALERDSFKWIPVEATVTL